MKSSTDHVILSLTITMVVVINSVNIYNSIINHHNGMVEHWRFLGVRDTQFPFRNARMCQNGHSGFRSDSLKYWAAVAANRFYFSFIVL
jgi:hypothetical protein